MTTRVTVANSGPGKVKVEVKGRDSEGQFTAEDESTLNVNSFQDFYVHDKQSLQIFEVKE